MIPTALRPRPDLHSKRSHKYLLTAQIKRQYTHVAGSFPPSLSVSSQVRQPGLRNVPGLDEVYETLEVLREVVEQRVEADDVHDEGDLSHHREKRQLRRAPRVRPLDVLALECPGGRRQHKETRQQGRRGKAGKRGHTTVVRHRARRNAK